jgi:hypothetical protein
MNDGYMRFVEASVFTKRLVRIADDDTYRRFQAELAVNPEKGPVIQGTGGLRKARMAARGKGKRGGARVVYLYLETARVVYLLSVYDKGEADDLSADEKKELRVVAEAIKQEYRR